MAILICGLNGSGKSTVGRYLAERLDRPFLDVEDLFFQKNDPTYIYNNARSKEDVTRLLEAEIKKNPRMVFASVKGDFGPLFLTSLEIIVYLEVSKEIRLARIRERSHQQFGTRMEPGGDLYEKEAKFFSFVNTRPEDYVQNWLKTVVCPILHIDGSLPVKDITSYLASKIDKS